MQKSPLGDPVVDSSSPLQIGMHETVLMWRMSRQVQKPMVLVEKKGIYSGEGFPVTV
jgi:hypothetical protein